MENSTPSKYAPVCLIQRLAALQAPGTGRQVAGGSRREAGGGRLVVATEIMTSVDIVVETLFLAWPLQRDLTIPHGHGVDNCSLRFCKKGRQFDLGKSRSPTRIFQRNQLLTSHRLWVYMYTFRADGDGDDGVGDGDHST